MAASDIVNRVYREFKRYTGDGLPSEPASAPLPVGDPSSGPYSPKKSELRAMLIDVLTEAQGSADDAQDALDDLLTKYLGSFADNAAATAAAGAPSEGQLYWNTTAKVFRYWDGDSWEPIPYAAVAPGSITAASVSDDEADQAAIFDKIAEKPVIMGVAADRAALAAMSGTTYLAVELMETGRKGLFLWDGSNLSAKVTIDTQQGVYLAPTSDPTGASGAWVRQFDGDLYGNWFGLASANTGTENVIAINAAITLASNLKLGTALPSGEFDIAVTGTPNGIKLVSNTHLYGQGSRYTILNLVGNSTNVMIDNYTGGSGIGRSYTPGVANGGVNNALVEDLAVVMNHPGDSINTAVCLQIAADFRNINRSVLRRCWLGNYHPRLNTKGFTQDFLVQGYAVMVGGKPGAAVDYAHQECNLIDGNTILGAFHGVSIEGRAVDAGAAYNTIVRKNDIQTCHTLIYQGLAGGAGNVIKDNTLQNLVQQNGGANPTRGIFMAGYGNIVDEPYGEYGDDAQYILYLAPSARRNRICYSATHTVVGGLIGGFVDNAGAGTFNIVEYFGNTGGAGTWNSQGAPIRLISNVSTTQT